MKTTMRSLSLTGLMVLSCGMTARAQYDPNYAAYPAPYHAAPASDTAADEPVNSSTDTSRKARELMALAPFFCFSSLLTFETTSLS